MFASWPHVCQLVFTIAQIACPRATRHPIFAMYRALYVCQLVPRLPACFYYSKNSLHQGLSATRQAICTIVKASRLHCCRQALSYLCKIQQIALLPTDGASYFCYSKDQLANVGPAGKYKKHSMFTIIGVSQQQSTLCCVR